ncbi:MAG: hypothetical protein JZU47_08120 [Prolixibacteraceae bacterium]|nr:hypothetical protein [Prolixibacteraceae bacterium]
MYKYSLYNKQKFTCPECGQVNKFQRYVDNTTGNLIDSKYGRCDREDSCQYWVQPEIEFINESESKFKDKVYDLYISDSLNSEVYINTFHKLKNTIGAYSKSNLIHNTFIDGLKKRFEINLVRKAYNDYKLGMCFNGSTIFPYFFNGDLKTGKVIKYNEDLHRSKLVNPNWLHSIESFTNFNNEYQNNDKIYNILFPIETEEYNDFIKFRDSYSIDSECDKFNYTIPIFGWDLLNIPENRNKTICLVEAEKTAIICSIVFPEFVWLASGGKSFLQAYKFTYHSNRDWLIFPDLSIEDKTEMYWRESIKKIKTKYSMIETFINYMPYGNNSFNISAKEKGLDIADYILEYPNYIDYMKSILKPYITEVIQPIKKTVIIPEIKKELPKISNTIIKSEPLYKSDYVVQKMTIRPTIISTERHIDNLKYLANHFKDIDSNLADFFKEPLTEIDSKNILPEEWFIEHWNDE